MLSFNTHAIDRVWCDHCAMLVLVCVFGPFHAFACRPVNDAVTFLRFNTHAVVRVAGALRNAVCICIRYGCCATSGHNWPLMDCKIMLLEPCFFGDNRGRYY